MKMDDDDRKEAEDLFWLYPGIQFKDRIFLEVLEKKLISLQKINEDVLVFEREGIKFYGLLKIVDLNNNKIILQRFSNKHYLDVMSSALSDLLFI